ncbi:MAG: hypothetical protein SFY80_09460 [Verrucomicrobiota bacterium]|nr:hypothetical protein [Verrucomicrobiota bacterium]
MKKQLLVIALILSILGCTTFSLQASDNNPRPQAADAQTSRAVFSESEENYPTIRITAESITVSLQQSGSGKVQGTSLRGSETYTFYSDGTYKVKPGTYKHIVFGQVPDKGKIVSIVRYR